jgi:hypothetical protein
MTDSGQHTDDDPRQHASEDPEITQNCHYLLEVPRRDGKDNYEDVFMTSIVQFKEEESSMNMIEDLDKSESFEAVEYLLENGRRDEVERLFQHGIQTRPEKAIDVYERIAEKDQKLAYDQLDEDVVPNEDLKTKMNAIYFVKNDHTDRFEDFGGYLEGYDPED